MPCWYSFTFYAARCALGIIPALLCLSFLCSGCALSQTSSPAPYPETFHRTEYQLIQQATKIRINQPLLWQIEKNSARSYIFGSIYDGVYIEELPFHIRLKLRNSRLAFFEPMHMRLNFSKGQIADLFGVRHFDLAYALSPEQWDRLTQIVDLDKNLLRRLHPQWVAALYESQLINAHGPIFDGSLTLELYLDASANGVTTRRLESLRQLRELFLKFFPTEKGLTKLQQLLLQDPTSMTHTVRVASAKALSSYRLGHIDGLTSRSLFYDSQRSFAELMKTRNLLWLSKIEAELAQGNIFIAVDAAHLQGPDGLIHLLQQQGYTLTRQ